MVTFRYTDRSINQILNHLSYDDLFSFRKINKDFKRIIDLKFESKHQFKSLVIYTKQFPFSAWFLEPEEILEYRYSLKVPILTKFFNSIHAKSKFSSVHNLFIYNYPQSDDENDVTISTSDLNHFKEVKKLEIAGVKIEYDDDPYIPISLHFPELISFFIFKIGSIKLTIIAEALINFGTANPFAEFRLICKNLKRIVCPEYHQSILEFKKLDYLFCFKIASLDIPNDFLKKLRNIAELHFMKTFNTYERLSEQKRRYERIRSDIYFLGIRTYDRKANLDAQFRLNEGKCRISEDNVNLYLNPNRCFGDLKVASRMPFIQEVDYSPSVMTLLKNTLHSTCFFNVNDFYINSLVTDQNELVYVLKTLKRLYCLTIKKSNLDQHFYDELGENVPSLMNLKVTEANREINFNFIATSVKNLITFETDQSIRLNAIKNAFENKQYLDYLQFKIKSKEIKVQRSKTKSQFQMIRIDSFDNISDLIDSLSVLRNKI